MIPWGAWRPDVGGPDTGIAQAADGVLPQSAGNGIGYGPMNAAVTPSGAVSLGDDPVGMITIQRQDGAWQDYAATATKIRVLDSTYDWDDIETGRTGPADGMDVGFALFGTYLLNSDANDGFKAYNYEAGGTNDVVSAAPTAEELCICNNVVFALRCDGNNRKMASSGLGDHTNWTTEGADGKTFEDGGALIAMRDLRNGAGLILQESALRLVQFGAAPQGALYTITKVADGLGALSSRSIAAFNGTAHWLSSGGFYEYVAGGAPIPIGDQKVNTWLAGQLTASDYASVQATVDPARKVTWFRLSATLLLGFHWTIREFFTLTVATSALLRLATPAVVIDDISTVIDNLNTPIDSLDFQGGPPSFGVLGSDLKVARFTGTPVAADLRTCELTAGGSKRFLQATPISDAATSTLSIGTSDSLASTLSYSTPAQRNEDGNVMLDDRGRYFAFREAIPAGATWTYSNGVEGPVTVPDAP